MRPIDARFLCRLAPSVLPRSWPLLIRDGVYHVVCVQDTWLGLLTRVWLGEFTPSLSRKFAIAKKRTVSSTWNLAELLLLQSDMVCENIYRCDGQFRDMSDFVTSLQATFDRKVTKLCESAKTQRRICKCNCKWKLPKDVKWRNLQGGYLGFSTLGGFDPEVSRNPFLKYPQIQLK